MTINSEHDLLSKSRLQPVLRLAHKLDIATNPSLAAIFEAGEGGFQVWCTPQDCPKDWAGIPMDAGSFSKPCEYVGSVIWQWDDEQIVALQIETSAYALAEHKPEQYLELIDIPEGETRRSIFNRPEDIAWLKEKVTWLFEQAKVPIPPFAHPDIQTTQPAPYILAHFVSDVGDYLVLVSPGCDPQDFCQPGYELVHAIEVHGADEFPVDVPLRPEYDYPEPDTEPDEGPLTEQYENASRLGDDDWMEAAYEDRVSGWDE
jgi:hypothetical protein